MKNNKMSRQLKVRVVIPLVAIALTLLPGCSASSLIQMAGSLLGSGAGAGGGTATQSSPLNGAVSGLLPGGN